MDTQLSNYVILKKGKPFVDPNGKKILYTLDNAVQMVKILEFNIDRYKNHSPYTIAKASHAIQH
tara:strand:- start:1538 stop:1729 length:192 start_codon:yes stop_codon:yes gene_type:complete